MEIAVDQHRYAPERAQALELVVAVEGCDRVDLVGETLEVHARQHLAHIGADEAADDPDHPRPLALFGHGGNGTGHAAFVALQM